MISYPCLNRHSSCTVIVYKLDTYAGAGSILNCASMRLGCLVPADWRWFTKFYHHYIWKIEISPVSPSINQQFKKKPNRHCGSIWHHKVDILMPIYIHVYWGAKVRSRSGLSSFRGVSIPKMGIRWVSVDFKSNFLFPYHSE